MHFDVSTGHAAPGLGAATGPVAGSPARRRPAPRRRPRKVPEPYLAESPKFEAIDGGPFPQVYTFGPNCQDGGL